MTRVDVLVFDGCEALDALGPAEVLRYGGLDVGVGTAGGDRLVRTSQGLRVQAQQLRGDAEWLVVPGGGWDDRQSSSSGGMIADIARRHRDRGGQLAAVCTGTMWLAAAGLVGARPATTHHRYWDELAALGADVRRGDRVVDDGDLVTSAGITSGLYLGLHLVERLAGPTAQRAVEAEIELPDIPRPDPGESPTRRGPGGVAAVRAQR